MKLNKKNFVSTIVLVVTIINTQYGQLLPKLVQVKSAFFIVHMSFFISLLYMCYAVLKCTSMDNKRDAVKIIRMFIPYVFLIVVVEILAVLLNSTYLTQYGERYWARFLSNCIGRMGSLFMVVSLILHNRENALQSILNAIKIDCIVVFINAIIKLGFINAMCGMLYPFGIVSGEQASVYFELHELTFTVGMILLYYLFFLREGEKNNKDLIFLIIIFIIGNKRIGLFALGLTALFYLFFKRKIMPKNIWIIFSGVSLFVFLFLYLNYKGEFILLLEKFNINPMGRDLIWPYFTRRSFFDIKYIGAGVFTTTKMLDNLPKEELLYMANVKGIHSDFLKIYFEYGCVGSVVWLGFFSLYLPTKMNRNFGLDSMKIYTVCIIYAFITYITDNTEGYPLFQSILFLLPFIRRKEFYTFKECDMLNDNCMSDGDMHSKEYKDI